LPSIDSNVLVRTHSVCFRTHIRHALFHNGRNLRSKSNLVGSDSGKVSIAVASYRFIRDTHGKIAHDDESVCPACVQTSGALSRQRELNSITRVSKCDSSDPISCALAARRPIVVVFKQWLCDRARCYLATV